jgi:sigma-B regulation protein RsbU (phosphoserine phosphatase)
MSNKGISFRLNSHITTIAIIIIATIVYINYHFSNKILKDKIEEGAINQSNLVISKISRITIGTEEIARNVSYQALYFHRNNDLEFLLKQVLASNKILESIHVELIDNQHQNLLRFSSDKPEQFIGNCDSLTTEQFIKKQKSGNNALNDGFWSDPFYCKGDTTHLLVSYKKPIFSPESKEMVGLVSCVISLNQMNQMLSEIKIGKSGYTFIIDRYGNLLTHPKKEWILKRNLFEKPSLIFSNDIHLIESEIKSGRRGANYGMSEYLKNQPAWYYYAPLSDSNWTVVIVIPESEMFKEINVIFKKITSVSVFGILILFLLNMFIFRRILDPLVRVTHAIQRFSTITGDKSKSKNEITMLAESLEDWQAKYGVLIKEQSKTVKEKLKYEKDLKSAHEIQQNIIPSGYPAFPEHQEIDLYAILKPAESIGGDLYDYYFIDDDHLLIAIGDVSGKGIPASLFMAIASTLIKSNSNILSSSEIIEKVNRELGDRNPNQYFLTLFIGILNIRTGIMDYCNAAHNYPYILHPDGTVQPLSKSHGIPLGIYKNRAYKSTTTELHFGDLILLYTDGVINSRDSAGTHYGDDKLKSNMQSMGDLTAKEVVTRLLQSINIYEGENLQSDDISLMALKYLNKIKNQV